MEVLALVLAAVLSVAGVLAQNAPLISTQQGVISGDMQRTVNGKIFYSYYGIPFARPPLQELRLKDPVAAEPWQGVRNGTILPEPCLQFPFGIATQGIRLSPERLIGSEDCLFLNVFKPLTKTPAGGFPVMVWIHGGGFFSGGAHEYLPSVLLDRDIVLVVIQYRLGIMGFLSTEDSVIPGNFGLKDQTLALQWVQRNIHNFGGDKTRVTIFGESAGGASVNLLILSPKSEGLFSRVIMQSGSALVPWTKTVNYKEVAERTGQAVGCPANLDSEDLLVCLQKGDARQMSALFQEYFKWFIVPLDFVPRVDGDFLPDEPARLVLEGRHKKVDLIAGVTADEGAMVTQAMYADRKLITALETNFSEIGPISILYQDEEDALDLTRRVYDHYVGGVLLDEAHSDQLSKMFTDVHFTMAHDLVTKHHARHAEGRKTFRYELVHRGQLSFGDFLDTKVGKHWVPHCDDLYYLFAGGPLLQPTERIRMMRSPKDVHLRHIITTLWTNFAATGNPTPDDSLGFIWEPSTEDNLHYLALKPEPTMEPDQRQEVREFHASLPTRMNSILYPEATSSRDGASQRPAADEL